LSCLAGPAIERLQLAFDVHCVLPRKSGADLTPLSKITVASCACRHALRRNSIPGNGLSLLKHAVLARQNLEFIGQKQWWCIVRRKFTRHESRRFLIEHRSNRAHFFVYASTRLVGSQ